MITGRFGFSYSCTKSCGRPCRSQSACASWQAQRMHRTSARGCVALAIAVPLLCSCPTRLHGSTRGLESNPHALAPVADARAMLPTGSVADVRAMLPTGSADARAMLSRLRCSVRKCFVAPPRALRVLESPRSNKVRPSPPRFACRGRRNLERAPTVQVHQVILKR